MSLPWICDFDDTFCDMVHTYDYALLDADVGEWRWETGTSRGRKQNLLTGPTSDANGHDNGNGSLILVTIEMLNYNSRSYFRIQLVVKVYSDTFY